MKGVKKKLLMGMWVIFATVLLSGIWARSDLPPHFSVGFSIWLVNLYGAKNQDEVGDLEAICMLVMSFGVVAFGTALALFIWQRLQRARKRKIP